MEIPFYKYHGTGNDFILIDNRLHVLCGNEHAFVAAACHRRFGIGADGVILLNLHPEYDFAMDYFNSDGHRSSMCGNGGRCIVQLAHDLGIVGDAARFLAVDGEHIAQITADRVNLKMGLPHGFKELGDNDFWIHTGSPHFVRLCQEDISKIDVPALGRAIRYSEPWAKEGTNVNFAQILPDGSVAVRTYERGVEDETWSCGTGVTAVAQVLQYVIPGLEKTVRLKTPGGELQVHLELGKEPWLQGPAKFVFQGTIDANLHV
jgi:diaminopimelate epimerase